MEDAATAAQDKAMRTLFLLHLPPSTAPWTRPMGQSDSDKRKQMAPQHKLPPWESGTLFARTTQNQQHD